MRKKKYLPVSAENWVNFKTTRNMINKSDAWYPGINGWTKITWDCRIVTTCTTAPKHENFRRKSGWWSGPPNDFSITSCWKEKSFSDFHSDSLLSFRHYKHWKGITFPPPHYSIPNTLSATLQSFSPTSFSTPTMATTFHYGTNIQFLV